MRPSLSLQLSLYRRQKAQIARSLEGVTRSFRTYQARYRRRTRTFQKVIARSEVEAQVVQSDVVYVGDYHTLQRAQRAFLELVERCLKDPRPVALALEFVESKHQSSVDEYLKGSLSESAFRARIGHGGPGFSLFDGFAPIFALAKKKKLRVAAIDARASGEGALTKRDEHAAAKIVALLSAKDQPRVLVLMGQFHIAPPHLPAQVSKRLPKRKLRELVVYQNCEDLYWSLAERGPVRDVEAVQIRPGELSLMNASPVMCQQSFLDYLEAEAGDEPLLDRSALERFREMAKLVAKFSGVELGEALEDVEVHTAADLDFLSRVKQRGRLSQKELDQVRKQVLSRESYYIPRARTAYLATLSLNHAAEEAAHFVRHCAVGAKMERPRKPADAFYSRCMEEALGFFGSRLVNPRRRCPQVADWARTFADSGGEDHQIAAFVLAHKAAELDAAEEAAALLPLGKERLFHGVSHALGYLLGDALYRGLDEGRVTKAEIRALFRDPFEDSAAAYLAWVRRLA